MSEHGRYIPLNKVADGGMAEIFLGEQSGAAGFRKLVVLKRILPAVARDEHFRNTLLDEAHIAMRLNHNNIVQVLDVGEAGGSAFLVLELVDGWSLAQVFKRANNARMALPLELALFIMGETCRGLAYAHTRKENGRPLRIVHRDISPQNVLLSVEGEVKVTDFGIARATVRADRTSQGTIKGKPNFMSPEQARGHELDARSDVFSVGIMLYQLATGVLPFKAATDLETMLRAQQAKFNPPQKVRDDLPKPLLRIINKAMKADPDERYQSAEEMLVAIEKVLRSSDRPAGQTELKRWMTELSEKDRGLPISQRVDPGTRKTDPPSEWIELSDLFVPPEVRTQPPTKRSTPQSLDPQISRTRKAETPGPPRKKRRWALRLAVILLLGTGVAAGYLYLTSPGSKVELPPRLKALLPSLGGSDGADDWTPLPEKTRDAGAKAATKVTPSESADAAVASMAVDAGVAAGAPEAATAAAEPVKPDAGPASAVVDPKSPPDLDPEMALVWIVSEPPGASIKLSNGRVLGTTPGRYRFHINTLFEITLEKPGYERTPKRFMVSGPQNPGLKVVMKPLH